MFEYGDIVDNRLKYKMLRMHPDAIIPVKTTEGSVCYDIYSVETVIIFPGQTEMIDTGWCFECPNGWGIEIRDRSGLSLKGIKRSAGVIDEDYRGVVKVILTNTTNKSFKVHIGDRIAQIKPIKIVDMVFIEVEKLSETDRGVGGFGSTGR